MSETKNKHTPGPWRTARFLGDSTIVAADGSNVAEISGRGYGHDSAHDAHLIAAAPDLYSALVEFLDASNVPEIMTREETLRLIRAEDAARAAIKKARGEE